MPLPDQAPPMPDDFAYQQGREAYLDGKSEDQNPYQRGTNCADEWERGWDAEFENYRYEVESAARDLVLDDPRRNQAKHLNRKIS